jgi:hypothetical protein
MNAFIRGAWTLEELAFIAIKYEIMATFQSGCRELGVPLGEL